MNEEILIRYRWTADELLAGHRANFRHRVRPIFRWGFVFLAALFVVASVSKLREGGASPMGLFLLFAALYIPLMFFVVRPWLVRRQFNKRPDRDAEIEFRISQERIHLQTGHGSSDVTWEGLAKVVQTPKGFLLYPTNEIFHWLPQHGFANQADFDRLAEIARQRAQEFRRIG